MTDNTVTHRYTYEVQRRWAAGLWSHQHIQGYPEDPRGFELSPLDPGAFARAIGDRFQPEGEWRIVVWDQLGVGHPPVAIHNPAEDNGDA